MKHVNKAIAEAVLQKVLDPAHFFDRPGDHGFFIFYVFSDRQS